MRGTIKANASKNYWENSIFLTIPDAIYVNIVLIVIRKMKTNKFTLLGFLAIALLIIPQNTLAHNRIVNSHINDAYYADMDDDGFEDDIWILLTVDFSDFGESDFENGIDYGYTLYLELPSGLLYSYIYYDVSYSTSESHLVVLIDHATEPGWYIASSTGFYRDLDRDQPFSTSQLIFDPPGGQSGGDVR